MTKYEFLYALRETLANALNPSQVEEQVLYYSNYIDEQVRLGYTEAQVLAELGDARSIAHNIIDGIQADAQANHSEDGSKTYTSNDTYYTDESGRTSEAGKDTVDKLKSYGKIAAILLVVFVVLIALTRLIIFALPTILTFAVIMWIIKKINGH